MTIRNKRLKKELLQLKEYNLSLNNNWDDNDEEEVNINYKFNNTQFSIHLNNNYPFSCPKVYIHNNGQIHDYIDWYLKNKKKHEIIQLFNICIPCICCDTITCKWAPTMNISNILDEIQYYYSIYYKIIQFNEIFNKIKNFDNLIYQTIFNFLY